MGRARAATRPAVRRKGLLRNRIDGDDFPLKQEFLAVMLGVQRPTVTVAMRTLQHHGLISTRYGRISILKRRALESASCECYDVIRAHFARLGL